MKSLYSILRTRSKVINKFRCRSSSKSSKSTILSDRYYPYSYSYRSSSEPLVNWTLGQLFDDSVEKFGPREAFVVCHQQKRKNFQHVKTDVDKLAAGLLALGLKPGNLIGIWSLNCYEWIIIQYATAKCGMILVHVNPAFQPREVHYCLSRIQMHCLFASDSIKSTNYYKILCTLIPSLTRSKKGKLRAESFPDLAHIIMISEKEFPGTWKFREITEAGGAAQVKELEDLRFQIQADSPSNIILTSGTTGSPKAAVISHFSLINNLNAVGKKLQLRDPRVSVCVPIPLFHTFGLGVGSLGPFVSGYKVVLPSQVYSADATAEAIQQERCTVVCGTPVMITDLFKLAHRYDLTSLKFACSGGAGIPSEVAAKISRKVAIPLLTGYGTTETTCAIAVPNVTDSCEIQVKKGLVFDHIEAKIVDKAGNIVPRGIRGELLIRGYTVMKEYWKNPDQTNKAITKDRWYKTGDVAVMDEQNYIEIVSRVKEVINRGGENIFPKEIEEFLLTNSKISDVQVIGVPDERFGESICAWIILKPNQSMREDDVKEFCKGQIAHFKIPKHILFVNEFPKSAVGKIQKFIMQEEIIKRFGLVKPKFFK